MHVMLNADTYTGLQAIIALGAEAVEPVAEIGDPRAVDPLVGVLRTSQSECCRALTAAALLKLGDPAGIAEVEKAFEQSDEAFTGLAMVAYEGT